GGCAAVASVTVAQPPAIVLQTQSANPICNGSMTGTASVNASGGSAPYAYLWSNGATTPGITNLGVGSYGVTVTDANGCPSSASVTITQPALLVVNTVGTNITCFGDNDGSATSTVSGGVLPYQYTWSNGSNATSLSNLGPGSYTLTITDANGCIGISSVLIVEPPVFSIQASAVDVSCNGSANGTATVTPTGGAGGYVYLWSHGPTTQNVSGLAPGTYFVTVTDAGGCFRSTSVTITQPTALVLQTQHTDVLCSGQANGTASVTASGATPAYSYAWSNGGNQSSVSGLAGGTYTVTVTDANGCTATRAIIVAEPPLLTVSTTGTDITCFAGTNGTATAVGAGGTPPYQYAWSNGAGGATAFGLGSGTYTVTATDGNGCTSTTSITLSEPTQISLTITGDNAVCEYETIDLNSVVTGGVPPYSYQWWSVAPAVNDTNPSLHYYDAHDDRTYFLNIIDQNGCEATASYYVESNPQPTADFIVDRTEICDTGTVLFTNLSTPTPLGSSWEFGDGQTSNGTSPSHLYGSGIWSVTLTVIDDQGCTNSMTQEQLIHVIPTPEASFVSDPNITLVDHLLLSQATITFNSTSSWFASGVDWSFGDGVSAFTGQVTHTYQDTGTYCITINAYNQFGCHDDSMQCITILQDPFLWIPTGFTPNGDGLNDIFFAGGVEIKQFEMWIFDRWGKLIFHSDAMDKGWDGKAMQEDSPEGAYVFKIHAVNNEGFKMDRAGTVTLIR
ncbi:MAG TPA: PKD domain-containing protein, partial [Bacteroidia bacterium]|nr:PKD domain-containing protein [Bacteroidia bacterium]